MSDDYDSDGQTTQTVKRTCGTCGRDLPRRAFRRQCATCIKESQGKGDVNKWRWQPGAEWARKEKATA